MILTDDLVYIHMPKTAGTFVTHILTRVYGLGRFVNTDELGTKHGTCSDIPPSHLGLPIVSTRRNPYERYVSQYRFGWWREYPESFCGEAEMRRLFPHYPELTFAEYLELANSRFAAYHRGEPTGYENANFSPERQLGWQTAVFLRFYARRPRELFNSLDETAIETQSFKRRLFEVRFLRVENLNRELHNYLLETGHDPGAVEFILEADRVLPKEGGREPGDRWQDYYTPNLLDVVRRRERLLFALFPEYDLPHDEILAAARVAS